MKPLRHLEISHCRNKLSCKKLCCRKYDLDRSTFSLGKSHLQHRWSSLAADLRNMPSDANLFPGVPTHPSVIVHSPCMTFTGSECPPPPKQEVSDSVGSLWEAGSSMTSHIFDVIFQLLSHHRSLVSLDLKYLGQDMCHC